MKLHAPLMALFYHPLQRVPIGLWCLSLLACEEPAPWFYIALIECVAFGSDLENDGIDTVFFEFIQLIEQRLLHLLGGHTQELSVDALYPCSPELTFDWSLRMEQRRSMEQCEK